MLLFVHIHVLFPQGCMAASEKQRCLCSVCKFFLVRVVFLWLLVDSSKSKTGMFGIREVSIISLVTCTRLEKKLDLIFGHSSWPLVWLNAKEKISLWDKYKLTSTLIPKILECNHIL